MEPRLGYDKGLKYTKDSILVFETESVGTARGVNYTQSGIITLTAETTHYLVGKTGTTRDVWMQLPRIISSEPDLEIYAHKDCVYSGGIPVTIYNKNHKNPVTTDWAEMFLNATVSDEGTKFYEDYIAGSTGIGGATTGGSSEGGEKYLFDNDTYYLMKLVNNSTNNNKIFYSIKWFESAVAI